MTNLDHDELLATPISPWPLLIRMALEGVPVRAIARILGISSEIIRFALYTSQKSGAIVQLPRDDWPPQLPREQRVPEFAKTSIDNALLILNVVRLFGVTQQQACLL